jgi:hypothetical protein
MYAHEQEEQNPYILHLPRIASFIILLYAQNSRQKNEKIHIHAGIARSTTHQSNRRDVSFTDTGLIQKRILLFFYRSRELMIKLRMHPIKYQWLQKHMVVQLDLSPVNLIYRQLKCSHPTMFNWNNFLSLHRFLQTANHHQTAIPSKHYPYSIFFFWYL